MSIVQDLLSESFPRWYEVIGEFKNPSAMFPTGNFKTVAVKIDREAFFAYFKIQKPAIAMPNVQDIQNYAYQLACDAGGKYIGKLSPLGTNPDLTTYTLHVADGLEENRAFEIINGCKVFELDPRPQQQGTLKKKFRVFLPDGTTKDIEADDEKAVHEFAQPLTSKFVPWGESGSVQYGVSEIKDGLVSHIKSSWVMHVSRKGI